MKLFEAKNIFIKRVWKNSDNIIQDGCYRNWGFAKLRSKLLDEIIIKKFRNERLLTREEKDEICKNCLEEGLIIEVGMKNKITFVLTKHGYQYVKKKDFERWIETYMGGK